MGAGRRQRSAEEADWARRFGERLARRRRKLGLTQRQLAMEVGKGHGLVDKWESGRVVISGYNLTLLERALKALESRESGRVVSAAVMAGSGSR